MTSVTPKDYLGNSFCNGFGVNGTVIIHYSGGVQERFRVWFQTVKVPTVLVDSHLGTQLAR